MRENMTVQTNEDTRAAYRWLRRRTIAIVYGVMCHGLFIIGITTMIAAMFYGMSRSLGTVRTPWTWIANIALLLQFPLIHSCLLSRPGRAIVARLAPIDLGPQLVATTYVTIASVQTFLLFGLWTPTGIIWWRAEGVSLILLTSLYTCSWLLLLKSMFDAGIGLQTGSLGWWSVLKDRPPSYPPMPAQGLFRLCRQPIYVSFALTVWTVPTWTPDQLTVASVLSAYCLIGPLFKEARFRRMFGEKFEAYRRVVPYWLPLRGLTFKADSSVRQTLNDLSIYETYAETWWTGEHRWLRTLHNLVPARLAHFDLLVDAWQGCRVLDLGCGGGFMSEALAGRGAVVTGIDPAQPALAIARSHAKSGGLSIIYLHGTGEAIPVKDATFDQVVCVDVLEHVDDIDTVLAEVHRVLRPGGLFLFDTINRNWLARLVIVTFGERILRLLPRGTHDPAKFITPDELRARLIQHGFAVHRFVGLGPKGLDRRFDFTFGLLPTTTIMYMGSATALSRDK